MANFYITNSKYPENPKLFTVNIQQIVKIVGEPDTEFYYDSRGESYWEIFIATDGLDAGGDTVDPYWVDVVASEGSIDALVASKIKELCLSIDWSQDGEFTEGVDTFAPFIYSQFPSKDQTSVPIDSTISFVVKEHLPGSGMDISSMYMKVKGIIVVPTVTGHPYEYTVSYSPRPLF